MATKTHNPISGFWTLVVPAVVGGLLFYTYNSHGWFPNRVRKMVDPVVNLITDLF